MKMNPRKITKRRVCLLVAAPLSFITAIFSVPVMAEAEYGVSSRGNIILDNGGMALYASDVDYLETEKDTLFSELPVLPDGLDFDGTRHKNIKSKGILDYAGGEVVIDTSDFMYLADEIDLLEAAYKINTVAALNYMGTYYMEDGSVTHDKSEESLPAEYAVNLSFEEIYEGVLQSQSVENLATMEVVIGASEDNLSAGTAAWLDGELVVGNGADNDTSYKEGYATGIADADKKINVSSASYEAGYNDGMKAGNSKTVYNIGNDYIEYVCPRSGNVSCSATVAFVNDNTGHNNSASSITISLNGTTQTTAGYRDAGYTSDHAYGRYSIGSLTLSVNKGDVIRLKSDCSVIRNLAATLYYHYIS